MCYFYFVIYNILVNAFYSHKYSYIFRLIKLSKCKELYQNWLNIIEKIMVTKVNQLIYIQNVFIRIL